MRSKKIHAHVSKGRLRNPRLTSRVSLVTGMILFAVIGTILLVATHAATPFLSIEAEAGTLTTKATVVPDANASMQSAVVFGTTSTTSVNLPNPGTWANVTSNLANMSSECGNLGFMTAVPGSANIIAGIANRGLWQSTNNGASWTALGTGTGSASIPNRTSWISFDPTSSSTFWQSGIYNGAGAFKTTNSGLNFTRLGTVDHNDYISIDFTDPNRQTLLLGGHEQSQTVWKSTNGGQTWTNIGGGLPSGSGFSSSPIIIDTQTYVVNTNPSWGGGSAGMYRTTNGGTSWTKVSNSAGNSPPLIASDGTIYFSIGDGLLKSTDKGLTWNQVGSGLAFEFHPIELPDKRLVSIGSGRLLVSADGGVSWTPFGANLPFGPNGIIYAPSDQSFYAWQWDCGNTVKPDAIMRLK